ncbi:MAG: hypothetical protein NTU94_09465 [Planctomycetota bacterium]|nr:hypothetical protein [Planctomycetota bacterium]
MTRTKPILLAVVFGLAGVWGASVLVMGQVDSLATALQQYEAKVNKKVDRTKADDLVAWAKWCYQNDKAAEANAIALEGLQKAPDDLRLKYLAYVLAETGPVAVTGGGDTIAPKRKAVGISKEDADKVFTQEGDQVMLKFREIQNRVLIPKCGKCHGGQDEKAKAKWWLIVKDANERGMLAENLQTLQPYIDRDKRMSSKILLVPSKSPETVHEQVFKSNKDPGYELMVRWILSLKGVNIFGTK